MAGVLFETVHAPAHAAGPTAGRCRTAGCRPRCVVDPGKLVGRAGPAAAAGGGGGDHRVRPRQGLPVQPHRERVREVRHLAAAGPALHADRQAGRAVVPDAGRGAAGCAARLQGAGRVQPRARSRRRRRSSSSMSWSRSSGSGRACYHRGRHAGLAVPEFPGLAAEPGGDAGARDHPGRAADDPGPAGYGAGVPGGAVDARSSTTACEIDTLRYNGAALNDYRNQRSTFRGPHAGQVAGRGGRRGLQPGLVPGPARHFPGMRWRGSTPRRSAGRSAREAAAYARKLADRHAPVPRHQACPGRAAGPVGRGPDR